MIFRKAEKEDFYKIRSLYWNLIDQEQNDLSFPHWKKESTHLIYYTRKKVTYELPTYEYNYWRWGE